MTGLIVLVTGGISVARWTLIPLEIDSTVESTSWVDSTTGRLRSLHLADGRDLVVDRQLVARATDPQAMLGASIHKDRWERRLHLGDATLGLPITEVVGRTLGALAGLVLLGAWLRRALDRVAS